MDRYSYSKAAFGSETFDKVQRSKILVVGAGGIGCELLKNLVLVGFKYIEIVDLDTIDVSNLNRQFLFRPHDVGQSKASVASNAARAFNPEVTIINHHGNVKEAKFGLPFIKKFDVVLNALDNVDARRHMNRLCLAANKPLIDSGTTGYLGQVMPIIKGHTSCYECAPKPTQKVYPVCTIRSTPDKPVHCIVWAKELFKLLFGKATDSMLYDGGSATSGPVNGNSGGVANEEAGDVSTYMHVVNLSKYVEGSGNGAKPTEDVVLSATRELLLGLFRSDLQKRIDMGVYKAAKQSPVPLPERAADQAVAAVLTAVRTIGTVKLIQLLHDAVQNGESLNDVISQSENIGAAVAKCSNCDAGANQWDQIALPLEEAALEFILSIFLATMVCYSPKISVSTTKPHQLASFYQIGLMEFDKDDAFAMRFVALSANLRCRAFHIAAESFHDCKGIAGNIIPAIAATNAIVAGMQVMQAVRILALDSGNCAAAAAACPHTYCNRSASRKGIYLMPTSAEKPYTDCFVCNRSQLLLKIDTMVATLGDVVSHVLKSKLGFNAPSVYLGEGCCLYEEGEDADEDLAANLVLILSRCPAGGIVDGSVLSVDDMTQDLEVQILVEHTDAAEFDEKEQPHGFTISGGNSKAKSVAETISTPTTSATAGDTCDSDEACLSVNAESNSTSASKKRPREQE